MSLRNLLFAMGDPGLLETPPRHVAGAAAAAMCVLDTSEASPLRSRLVAPWVSLPPVIHTQALATASPEPLALLPISC